MKVAHLIREADPIRLIATGAPQDEYEPEVGTILPRLRKAQSSANVQMIVHEEFVRWFGADIAGPRAQYRRVGSAIWKVWQRLSEDAG